MADTYLPADVRKRIIDVMRERKLTQRELALRIDVNESTISRFLSGKTEKLSEESVIRIARVFNAVSYTHLSRCLLLSSSYKLIDKLMFFTLKYFFLRYLPLIRSSAFLRKETRELRHIFRVDSCQKFRIPIY